MELSEIVTRFVPLSDVAPDQVEGLLDRAFGADRFGRTAYRVRAGTTPIASLSAAALTEEGALAGSIQAWPVELADDSGKRHPLIMIGPVAVEPALQQSGIGRALMRHLLHAAARSNEPGADALMLIGDPEYYGRFFGFSAERTGGWRLPGPVEARRLLARGEAVPALAGALGPRLLVTV